MSTEQKSWVSTEQTTVERGGESYRESGNTLPRSTKRTGYKFEVVNCVVRNFHQQEFVHINSRPSCAGTTCRLQVIKMFHWIYTILCFSSSHLCVIPLFCSRRWMTTLFFLSVSLPFSIFLCILYDLSILDLSFSLYSPSGLYLSLCPTETLTCRGPRTHSQSCCQLRYPQMHQPGLHPQWSFHRGQDLWVATKWLPVTASL